MNIQGIDSSKNSFKGLEISHQAQEKISTKSVEYLNSLLKAKQQLQSIVDYNMVIGDNLEISVEKAMPKVTEVKQSFFKGLFGKIFNTQEKQVQQKPYNYFKTLVDEMNNAGKYYYVECGGEGHGGFYPDIPSTLTSLWSGIEKNIKPAEEYAKFKTLDELSKAVELTKLLNEVAKLKKQKQELLIQKAMENQKKLEEERLSKQKIINEIIK